MYEHIVSLGWYCGVAASMSRYGFREMSGPFDWMFSDFEGVLHFLETSFEDFLDPNHIQIISATRFEDDRGLLFNHDCKSDFALEYPQIKKKYMRRIAKFNSYNNICFIRAVKDQKELEYIRKNEEYIKAVIGDNDIIFLIPHYLDYAGFFFPYFVLDIYTYYGGFRAALRVLFDKCKNLVAYLTENYSSNKIEKNLVFDKEAEPKNVDVGLIEQIAIHDIDKAYKRVLINEERCQNLAKMLRKDFSKLPLPDEMEIYGMGTVGEAFYDLVKRYTKVKCFIDRNGGCAEIPVIKLENYKSENRKIIVTPTFFFDGIKEDLCGVGVKKENIISLKELLNMDDY